MASSNQATYHAITFDIGKINLEFVISRLLYLCEEIKEEGQDKLVNVFGTWATNGMLHKLINSLVGYIKDGINTFQTSDLLHMMICICKVYMKRKEKYLYSMPISKDDNQTIHIQVKVSPIGFTAEDYKYLEDHFKDEDDKDRRSKPRPRPIKNCAISMFAYIVETSLKLETPRLQCKTNISSPGSKQSISSNLQLPDGIGSCFEGFARTFSISLSYRKSKSDIKLVYNDIDWRFCNYMRMLVDYPVQLITRIKSIGAAIILYSVYYSRCKSINVNYSMSDDVKQCIKNSYSDFKKMANIKQGTADTLDKKIEAAAALFWLVNLSYQGNEKAGCGTTNITRNFPKKINELMLASIRLQGITILQMDIKDFIKKFKNRSDVLVILDPPYLGLNGENCVDYINNATDTEPFTRWDMKEMFRQCLLAKFKVLFFHSYNETVFKLCEEYSFRYQFSYSGQKKRGVYSDVNDLNDNHNTIVCTLRIDTPIYNSKSDKVKFCEALNVRLDGVSVSSAKGGEA